MWMEWTSHTYECVCSVNIKFIANWHSEKSNITCLKVGLTEKSGSKSHLQQGNREVENKRLCEKMPRS